MNNQQFRGHPDCKSKTASDAQMATEGEKKKWYSPYKIQQDKILEASNPTDTAQLAASLFFTEPRPSNEPRQCWPKPRNAKRIKIQNTHPGRLLAISDFKLGTVVAFSGGISSDICSLQIEVRTAAEHAQSWTTSMSRCQQYWCDLGCVLVTGFNVFDEKNNESQKVQCVKSFFDNWSEQDWILCVSLFFGAVCNHPFMWVSRLQSLWSFPPMRCGPASLEPSTPELAPHTSHVISHHLTTRQWPEQNCQSCEHNDTQMNWLQWLIIIHSGVHMRNSIYPSIYPSIHPSIHMYIYIYIYCTHTCSETSYRITDVECIARAKTLQLNLTGMVWWLEVRNCARKSFYVLARRIYLFWCSSVRLRKPYSSLKTVGKTTCRFLA